MDKDLCAPSIFELTALRAVAEHGTIRGAAQSLGISPHTIDFYLDCLRGKTGKRYLPQLVAWGYRNGWLDV